MAVINRNILNRIYGVALLILVMSSAVAVKLSNIQWVEGTYYRQLAKERTIKNFVIPANRGNVYSSDGSLLATSIPEYTIRFDALAPSQENFDKHIRSLADSLAPMLRKSSSSLLNDFRKARANKNRYMLVARKLSYTEHAKIKGFPLLNLGAYKGGIIIEQQTVREHPIGKIAERTIGYERFNDGGSLTRVGIEGAFGKYLKGKDGQVLKQKIAKGQWKPIRDNNEVEPIDGYDIVSTIDVYIQDIAHHALLKQLELYEAEHGCAVVMETKTGDIKAISNLGRAKDGSYYETINYAVAESHEPGSTFKLVDVLALLEDKKIDTSKIYNTYGGVVVYRGRKVKDSHDGGYGKISFARGFELSSNTVLVQAVYENYKDNPQQFVDHINYLGLNTSLGLPFKGEGKPRIPQPRKGNWSGISLPWMAFGYGVSVTPLQTLTLYNAVANNGIMVKPKFVQEVKEWNKVIKKFDTEVINSKICSNSTLLKVKAMLKNVVKRGTASKLYSKDFSMAGKTGTAQIDYHKGDTQMYYASSFAGYFPAEDPQYSCIVVIHKPNTSSNNYYGADVAGPVFKRIAQKVFTDVPSTDEIKSLKRKVNKQEKSYLAYNEKLNKKPVYVPNTKGMPGMDAVALLENLGMKVRVSGFGKVKKQSIQAGELIRKNKVIVLELS
ncbi:penicillin-binding protein [Flavobacterium oreochromis]|uniref:penicillin-binding protein n=1 Tax=Flavobacterium oreochromis TaxID=2906078 RepID=UPI001CE5AF81|nr:penicillin-binding protein [Flavobacterium oreochromis]QYS86797.1 transpeptidase family protein [Flavobacterium oreochromis]